MRIGALEAGGTKMVLGVYTQDGTCLKQHTLSTRTPEETVPQIIAFFADEKINALGIGSFGPLDLNPDSSSYGYITCTPKPAWKDYPLLSTMQRSLGVPVNIDTDVNAAVLAEARFGAAVGCRNAVYVTVGTGIGGGLLVNGQLVHGAGHPEVGHMLLRAHPDDPIPEGICPYHKGCLEGLASGPALAARAGCDPRNLADDHPALQIEAWYLAQMCLNLTMTLSTERIILGGGVMQRAALLDDVRIQTMRFINYYVQNPSLNNVKVYITAPKLYPYSGLYGSYLLGLAAR